MRTTALRRLSRASRRGSRGFTLIELMGAMIAGMFVALGAFAFAKGSARAFQSEARLGNATSAATMGFRRLVADIRRAAFLSTPNIQREYRSANNVCLSPTGATPLGIQTLAGIHIEQWGYAPQTALSAAFVNAETLNDGNLASNAKSGVGANPLLPDRITIAGSFDSTEQFFVRNVASMGGQVVVYIQPASGASTRLLKGIANNNAAVDTVFKQNRIVRIVDNRGYQHFGVIQNATTRVDPSGQFGMMPQIVITLLGVPGQFIQGQPAPGLSNLGCNGMDPNGVGMTLSVVNKIRYELRTADKIPDLAALIGNPLGNANTNTNAPVIATPPEDATRGELVRSELDYTDTPIPGTDELVAEFAVDLHFGLTVDTSAALNPGQVPNPNVTTLEIGSPAIYQWAGVGTTNPGPERIKSVRVRFGARSREADRETDVALPPWGSWYSTQSGQPGGILRYQIGNTPATNHWARVRTLQTDVLLSNQQGNFY